MSRAGLLLMLMLAGCAAPLADPAAASAPEPGSVTAHINGRVVVMGGVRSVR